MAQRQDLRHVEADERRGGAPFGKVTLRLPIHLRSQPADVEAHLLQGWRRILGRAGLPHIGTHGIQHRSATDIANSGIPVKVGMALTAHKTVTMFMRYVHTEDDPVRAAADAVAFRRQGLIGDDVAPVATKSTPARIIAPETVAGSTAEGDKPLGFEDGNYKSRTKLGNYRPFRHRGGPNRAVPPGTRRNANEVKDLPLRRQRS